MADAAIFIGWGPAIYGREQQAFTLFGEAMAYYAQLQQGGAIESFEAVGIEAHGGDLAGCLLIRGSREQLHQLRADAEFQRLNTRALLTVTHFGVVDAYIGAGLERWFAGFAEEVAKLP